MLCLSVSEAIDRARGIAEASPRALLGITGQPGVGKSTFAAALAAQIDGSIVLPMDGFHLAHCALINRDAVERKGAVDTFDADGYLALLRRVRAGGARTVWAPEFRREIEDAVAGAIAIEPETALVITEGNYLLADVPPWDEVRSLCDEVWYLEVPDRTRVERLTARHMEFGRSRREAWDRSTCGSDAVNATLVAGTRERADLVVRFA